MIPQIQSDPISSPVRPVSPISSVNWQTQIQQLKTAGTLAKPAVLQPSGPATVSPGSQGLPLVVTIGNVSRKTLANGQLEISVEFTRNPSDQNFQSATIYLKQGNGQPSLVTTCNTSPGTFITPRSNSAAAVILQSVGNFGALTLSNSPAKALSLA